MPHRPEQVASLTLQQHGRTMKLSFTCCQAVSWDVFYVCGCRDDAEPFAPFSAVLQYARGQQREGRDWAFDEYPFVVSDMSLFFWDKVDARIL